MKMIQEKIKKFLDADFPGNVYNLYKFLIKNNIFFIPYLTHGHIAGKEVDFLMFVFLQKKIL